LKSHCSKAKIILASILMTIVLAAAMLCLSGAGTASGMIGLSSSPEIIPGPDLPGKLPAPQSSDPFTVLPSSETLPPAAGNTPDEQQPPEPEQTSPEPERDGKSSTDLLRCMHYNEKEFIRSVFAKFPASDTMTFEQSEDTGTGTVYGGIVPHHLLARRLIAEFFRALAEDPPETVIVIGPNHKLEGTGEIQTTPTDWGTPFGILEADHAIVARLAEEAGAARNDDLFEVEHSVSALVPYIKYFLPEAKIAPVLLHGSLPREKAKEFGAMLGEILAEDPDTVIIASIDFSHYLSTPEADEMDIITWDAIRSWDMQALGRMGNDNLDSAPTILALMTAMDAMSAVNIELTGHNNSSRITQSGYDYTTSYFTMFFRKQ
jgi:AmmeMemoRadiSam system protein B